MMKMMTWCVRSRHSREIRAWWTPTRLSTLILTAPSTRPHGVNPILSMKRSITQRKGGEFLKMGLFSKSHSNNSTRPIFKTLMSGTNLSTDTKRFSLPCLSRMRATPQSNSLIQYPLRALSLIILKTPKWNQRRPHARKIRDAVRSRHKERVVDEEALKDRGRALTTPRRLNWVL